MYCTNCGPKQSEKSKYCSSCGNKLNGEGEEKNYIGENKIHESTINAHMMNKGMINNISDDYCHRCKCPLLK